MASGDQVAQYTLVSVYSEDDLWGGYGGITASPGTPTSLTRTQTLMGSGDSWPDRSVQKFTMLSVGSSLSDAFGLDQSKTYTITITET